MDRRTKREIRYLAHESWMGRLSRHDPHRDDRQRTGDSALGRFGDRLASSGDMGALLMLAAPVLPTIPVIWIATRGSGSAALDASIILLIILLVAVALRRAFGALRERRQLIDINYSACLWCHHPLTDDMEIGRCPECGLTYHADINRRLIEMTLSPARPEARIYLHRAARLWARAVIWRERGRLADGHRESG